MQGSGLGNKAGVCSIAVALLVVAVAATGCGGPASDTPTPIPTYDPNTGRLSKLTTDLSGDGKADTWVYMNGTKVLRAERDRNQDGRIDYWEFDLPDGTGGIEHIEEDSNGDGRPDHWTFFAGPVIRAVEWDEDFDGVRDRRLTYNPAGQVTRIETRADGAGGYLEIRDVPVDK